MIGVNLQTSFLTPPFGFALFYLRGVAKRMVRTIDIYRGVVPFVGLQVLGLALVWMFPRMATYLPEKLYAPEVHAAEPTPSSGPTAPSGSPVGDDFSDLFEEPQPGKNEPWMDDLRDVGK
jgi:hypothetical protein